MKKSIKKVWMLGISLTILASGLKVQAAETNEVSTDGLESKVDSFFDQKMKEYKIPGAAVVVVDHGEVVLEKCYGYSNQEEQKEFDKDTTFQIASITKTFTAAALMQLVEQGKVDLDSDIKEYLPNLKIRNPYDVPITVKDLLTYSSGLDSSVLSDLSKSEILRPCGFLLEEMNKKNLTVVTKPGTHIEYCSYGVVLEGCIIEEITGESCEDYIAQHILKPLQMTHTKMSMMDEAMSQGYIVNGDQPKAYTVDGYFKIYPEGGLSSSIEDMSHYIKAFLNDGDYEGERILSPRSVQRMMEQQMTYDALLPGMCYGFSEYDSQGVRLVGHGGYAPGGFLTQMDLYPQYDSGTFVIVNQGNNDITGEFRDFFIECMNWEQEAVKTDKKEDSQDPCKVEGTYRFSDYSKTTLCKGDTFGGVGEVTIKVEDKDEICLKGINEFTSDSYEYYADKIDETHYQIKGESRFIVFLTDGDKVTGMAMTDDSWHGYYEKIQWYESGSVQVPFVIVAITMYLGSILVLLVCSIIRKVRKNGKEISSWNRKRYLLVIGISFLNAGFLIYGLYNWGDRLRYSMPLDVKINLMMPLIGIVGMCLLLWMIIKEIITKQVKLRCIVFDISFLLISIIYVMLLNYWNLLGFHY